MPTRESERFGRFLKQQRENSGLSRLALAKAAGLDVGYISKLERGFYQTPSPVVLRRIAHALSIEPEDIYTGAGYTIGEDLPSFNMYLRAKYDLSPEAIEQLEDTLRQLDADYETEEGGGHGEPTP